MKRLRFSIFLGFLLIPLMPCSGASSPAPKDFAEGIPLTVQTEAPIYRFLLPEAVYLGVTRADLGDIRIFSGEDRSVTHEIRKSRPRIQTTSRTRSLPLFPVAAARDSSEAGLRLHITTDETGAIIRTRPDPEASDADLPTSYLIDIGGLEQPPGRLRFHWRQTGENTVVKMMISESDDLATWKPLIRDAAIARLTFGGQVLERNHVDVRRIHGRYLRVTWPEGNPNAELTGVDAEFQTGRETRQLRRRQTEAASVRKKGNRIIREYDTGGAFPAEELNFRFNGGNRIIRGAVKSRPDENSPWRERYRGDFYHLTVKGTELTNPPVRVSGGRDRHWLLETEAPPSGESASPDLILRWQPQELLFLAEGPPPYLLAFGSGKARPPAGPASSLFTQLADKKGIAAPAYPGEPVILSGDAARIPPPEPLPWKRMILWTVLIGGVILLGVMAWRLFRQMNTGENAS